MAYKVFLTEKDLMPSEKTSRIAIIPAASMITEKASTVQTHYSKKTRTWGFASDSALLNTAEGGHLKDRLGKSVATESFRREGFSRALFVRKTGKKAVFVWHGHWRGA
ncbi:MAG: hypothetical protein LBL72_01220 [Candidatus Accumulibacter sp.]|jgi:hypothetical protein|nr:hypothetical protein [Accumulibacter sp.]